MEADAIFEVSIKAIVQSLYNPMFGVQCKLMLLLKSQLMVHCNPFITLCLGFIEIDSVTRESSYQGTILQRNYRKMTMEWSFSYNFLVKFNYEKFGSSNMTVLYPNLHFNEACYKGAA